ncbi:zinc-binding dehydrogenase [Streptomyces sp. NBC_01341]|uniref:zinc-binding dehydrogenase n=1 Tax=Streptomyces sp. NBC_01341 TaxID=2903831 RepID=UPI002E0EC738|nr:zinc-binding dehydrogenase [Streptomyces sp. NBC_01341]
MGLARTSDADGPTRAGAAETITDLKGAAGFDAVLDAALLDEVVLPAVRDNGLYAGAFPGREPESERGIGVTSGVIAPDGRRLRELLALTAEGRLEARRAGTVALDGAAQAYQALRDGGQRGRWVWTP